MEDEFLVIAEAFLKAVSGELDPSTEEKGIIVVDKEGNSVSLFTPSHIQFAKYGRGPGKQPPVDDILKWVSKKGIVSGVKEQLGMAWGIAISISKNGTKNWVPNAPNALQEAIDNNIQKYYDDTNKEVVKIESEKIDKILREEFPKEIEFKI